MVRKMAISMRALSFLNEATSLSILASNASKLKQKASK